MIAAFSFFFLPLLEIKPNRLASGILVNLFEIEGDLRYLALFVLALIAIVLAFQSDRLRRGWSLVFVGNLLLFLTLVLPANAAIELLEGAASLFEEGTRISNPRIFPSGAIAIGLLGSYIVIFGGLRDLVEEQAPPWQRFFASSIGIIFVILALVNGSLDIYSIMVEYAQRGETLGQRLIEHAVFVLVSLGAGLVIGIALGLWAARDERVEDIILYVVGIIQTIPSLALFGVLLVPLARLGDLPFLDILQFFIISLIVGLVVLFVVIRSQSRLPDQLKAPSLIVAALAMFVPLSLFTVIFITFGFRSLLNVFNTASLSQPLLLVILGFALIPVFTWLSRRIDRKRVRQGLRYGRYVLAAVSGIGLVVLMISGAQEVIGSRMIEDLTVRHLGVSGIGTAPAIIALTLYSLLPLVRNTYAGLKNVDPAIIDSGRGMGMTPSQIFFQIELPLAFPVIMAGVRNAGIALVGIAAVASIIGAGALGDFILLGVNSTSIDLILLGAIPAIILAVILDAGMQLLEQLFTSPGIARQQQ